MYMFKHKVDLGLYSQIFYKIFMLTFLNKNAHSLLISIYVCSRQLWTFSHRR